jgi:serine phosphatase RsbU (regulator of sigma subunit)
LLPDYESVLPQAFVVNLPRDIVSGDFYWVKKSKGQTLIAMADCTGHGTSAAFITILGITLLNEISEESTDSLSTILEKLDERLSYLLKAKETYGLADGMDIALIRIDEQAKTLDFAGANQSLYIINEGELEEYKGDRVPIGFSRMYSDKVFTQQAIPYPAQGSMLYMASDGYQDQFGGARDRKFMKKHFKNLLLTLHQKDLATQETTLVETFQNWKGKQKQTDDVVVMGIKIS